MAVVIILLLVVVAVLYFKFAADPASLKIELKKKVRNENQKKALRYFLVDNEGCLGFLKKTVKDADYDALVESTLASINSRQNAINKIGLDESELKEIEPVTFEGYVFGDNNFAKRGADNLWRSSKYQISWLFFTDKQVFLYQYTFNLDEDGKKEATEEYFWKDITNFSTSSDTIEQTYYDYKAKQEKKENVQSSRFALTVPGDKFYCWMQQNDDKERAIQAMKAKLREKKNA